MANNGLDGRRRLRTRGWGSGHGRRVSAAPF